VVITNKNTIAIALYYDRKVMHAPTITILGRNKLAQNIIDMAKDNNIPIIENVEQVKDMVNEFIPGDFISEGYYEIVARIFSKIKN
jgi:flagellar biosynthetic protein FlhB